MDKWNEEFEIDEEILERFQRRMNAMKEFMRINDPEKYERLRRTDYLWAPELKIDMYSE